MEERVVVRGEYDGCCPATARFSRSWRSATEVVVMSARADLANLLGETERISRLLRSFYLDIKRQ